MQNKCRHSLHEPWMCRADIPVCRFGRLSSRPKQKNGTGMSREPAGWKACARSQSRFMLPMQAEKSRKEAFHERHCAAGILPAESSEKSTAGKMSAACWLFALLLIAGGTGQSRGAEEQSGRDNTLNLLEGRRR